jgi:hypothetical protein
VAKGSTRSWNLNVEGIKVFLGTGDTVKSLALKFQKGNLKGFDTEGVCAITGVIGGKLSHHLHPTFVPTSEMYVCRLEQIITKDFFLVFGYFLSFLSKLFLSAFINQTKINGLKKKKGEQDD